MKVSLSTGLAGFAAGLGNRDGDGTVGGVFLIAEVPSRHRPGWNWWSKVGEGLADGEAGGAGCRGFGGEKRAEDDECSPTGGGDRGDAVGQWC